MIIGKAASAEPVPQDDCPTVPVVGQGKRGTQGYVGYLLRQANAALRISFDRALAPHGLTFPQFLVMTMIRAYPRISGAGIARLAQLTPQTVHVITQNLDRAGLLRKQGGSADRRVLHFQLTPLGARLLQASRPAADEVEARLLAGLSTEAEVQLRRWLVGIAEAVPENEVFG